MGCMSSDPLGLVMIYHPPASGVVHPLSFMGTGHASSGAVAIREFLRPVESGRDSARWIVTQYKAENT
jgi:hypothetical protein